MALASRAEVSGAGTRDEPLRTSAWEASMTPMYKVYKQSFTQFGQETLFGCAVLEHAGDLVNLILNYVNYLLS